jgi:IS605 OrfB family transposase
LLGSNFDKAARARLKRELTARGLTARMAGSLLGEALEAWRLARRNQKRHFKSLEQSIAEIKRRLALAPEERQGKGKLGYLMRERGAKKMRLAALEARLEQAAAAKASGQVSIVRGGKKLLKKRHSLAEADLTLAEWQALWHSTREKISFAGESGKRYGNETLRVDPLSGEVVLRLPDKLAYLANRPHQRYALDARALFSFRGAEWRFRALADQSIAYTISCDPSKGRTYLDATFKQPTPALVKDTGRTVGVDLNGDHLACWVTDAQGNPCGAPRTIPLELTGLKATTRDARLREALTEVIRYAREQRASRVSIEDLGWAEEGDREHYTKRFRRTIHGIPTAKLKERAAGMFARAGLRLTAVDPAYTSKWAREHWLQALQSKQFIVSGHEAASLMIARRAQGFGGRRRRRSRQDQRILTAVSVLEHVSAATLLSSGPREQFGEGGGRADPSDQKTRVLQSRRSREATKGKTVRPSEVLSRMTRF